MSGGSGVECVPAALGPPDFVPFAATAIEQSLASRFEQQVRNAPGRIAVCTRQQVLSYAELNRWANHIAAAVLAAGTPRSTPVALMFGQDAALVAAILGVLKSGRPYVGLDPGHDGAALRRTLEHCGAALLLTCTPHADLAGAIAAAGVARCNIDAIDASAPAQDPELQRAPDDAAYIYYTSGTTGVPKGVVDNQRNVLHNVMRYTNSLRISPSDRLTLLQSVAFSGAVSSLFCALLNGGTCLPIDLRREGFEGLAEWLAAQRATVYHSVPSIFQRLVATGRPLPSLRVVRLEGDLATPRHVALFQAHFKPGVILVNGLGATETGISHQYPIDHGTRLSDSIVPVGYPNDGMRALIVDADGTTLPPGQIGEIAIRSRHLAVGYWRQPELTAQRFLPDPGAGPERIYRSGDQGRLRPDGCLELLGRSDHLRRLHGRWVDGPAIEAALLQHGGLRDAVVVVHEPPGADAELVVYVVADSGGARDAERLRRVLQAQPEGLALPTRFVWLDALPLDANGKVQRHALPDPHRPQAAQAAFERMANATERQLAAIWCEVLGTASVDRDDDFGALGGDSLQALDIATRIEQHFGVSLAASALLEAPTIAAMARWLDAAPHGDSVVVPLSPSAPGPALFCLHDGSGDVVAYGELARQLGAEWPLVGVRARGLDGREAPLNTVPELAAHCVAALRQAQPAGPYRLAGNCFAGLVAYECARQLRAAGQSVALLVLIDTAYPSGRWRSKVQRHLRRLSRQSLTGQCAHLWALAGRMLGRLVATPAGRSLPATGRATPARAAVMAANFEAEWAYKPPPTDRPVVLVHAGALYNQRGWRHVAHGMLQCLQLPDDPLDRHLLGPPNVGALAECLRPLLRGARDADAG